MTIVTYSRGHLDTSKQLFLVVPVVLFVIAVVIGILTLREALRQGPPIAVPLIAFVILVVVLFVVVRT